MRITSGIYKGRTIKRVSSDETRETADKVKQAMFNMLFDVTDKVLLDVFSGSGQLSFEAISRGARHVIAVDKEKEAIMTILDNAMMLGCQKKMTLIEHDISLKSMPQFSQDLDIIIMDPPYGYDLYEALLLKLPQAHDVIIETSKHTTLMQEIGSYVLKKEKIYGKKKLFYYQLKT